MADHAQNIKDSINLPKTTFPMKANLAQREPELIKKWKTDNVYEKMVATKGERFSMPDGPPYANGHIHMGHTLNKCLKDFVIKYQNMNGKQAPYIPGWDCHGLPIEHNITKKLGPKIREKSKQDVRGLCREEAHKWVDTQKEEFIRLGILGDWDTPYLTLNPGYEAEEVREFARIFKNGVIYRGKKPVHWCIPLQTALAEAEIEYQDHKSPSIYVKFPYTPHKKFGEFSKPVFCVIWTTTPWTLPANQGVALHPDFDYSFYEVGDDIFLIATDMKDSFEKDTELELGTPIATFKGTDFEGENAQHPWYERPSKFVLGDHVTLEAGTGVVHTAPGHGQDDYIVGMKYGLPLTSPVKSNGTYNKDVPEYEGLNVFKANDVIVEDLKTKNRLVALKVIKHSYPHCWRSKTPLIFRATSQWFIRMDDPTYNIREKALAALEDIQFVPSWGAKRLNAMIENRPDWCISRQRNWGVPLPIFYCGECDEPHLDEAAMERVAVAMEKGSGIEAYYDTPIEDFIGDAQCSACGSKTFKKGQDILDVWFDSGICHAAVQKKRDGLDFPADLYLEGSDQHRGWFQTSLLTAIASSGQSPFKTLLTHNFVNDKKGRKMSKSLGNVVDPLDLIKKSGAELLRLWSASQDYGQDMNYSQEGFQRVTETYRRLRNTLRFLLGNIDDFDAGKDGVPIEDLEPFDRWALDGFAQFLETIYEAYSKFEFYKVYQAMNNYFTVDLSAHYLDVLKDRLYTAKTTGHQRRSCQTVLHLITETLIPVMAPITSFLSEEAFGHFKGSQGSSVFESQFPKIPASWTETTLRQDFATLFEVRSIVSKELEEKRRDKVIGSSLEAQVQLKASKDHMQVLERYSSILREIFIVSHVELAAASASETTALASAASGDKCPRCWHFAELQELESFGTICPKCVEALS